MNGSACQQDAGGPRGSNPQSEIELARRARALAQPLAEEAVEPETLHLLTFSLGEERYAVDISQVQEIRPLEPQTWSPVPCTPDFIVGVVNVRGRIYSLMDVARFMGLPSQPPSETAHILLVRGEAGIGPDARSMSADARSMSAVPGAEGEMELAILMDDLPQVVVVSLSEMPSPTISGKAQAYVRGVTDDMRVVLSLERLLADPGILVYEEVEE
jgi:purine-binding chemotaxis protein CheW